jgi:tRNA-specific 2-thiouridylase
VIFPLGDYTKTEIRSLAAECRLPVAAKPESQEICFVPGDDYRAYLEEYALPSGMPLSRYCRPGPIVDTQGAVLGRHRGCAFYTIGQRQGLGIAHRHPLYVVRIDARRNTITVGSKDQAHSRGCLVKQPTFIATAIKKKVALKVRIRYNHSEAQASVAPCGTKLKVTFAEPQFAVTPGQSAVLYDRDLVVGGGIIERIIDD